jgi:hypothetical protein
MKKAAVKPKEAEKASVQIIVKSHYSGEKNMTDVFAGLIVYSQHQGVRNN